ncbi:MAG: hypothetical protein ABR510_06230 [Trueperaceae bacterium]
MADAPDRRRRRRRILRWIAAIVLGGAAVTAGLGWWTQRQATRLAAELLTRAVERVAAAPEVPAWPLDAPFAANPDAAPFPFAPDRPTLVVLIHGMTPNRDLDPTVGTHAFARTYWSFAFVRALLGGRAPQVPGGAPLTPESWRASAPDDDDPRAGLFFGEGADVDLGVFIVVRDGSLGLGAQAIATAAQIAAGLDAYREATAVAGRTVEPQVALIAHSFGGLVARYLLVNPPLEGGPFGTDATTRARADALRDRTLWLLTLGTPHEGSAAADRAMLVEAAGDLFRAEVLRPHPVVRDWITPLLDDSASFLRLEDPVTAHLRTDVWAALNDPDTGLLAAHRVRRGDGSVVPVAALAARATGGAFFVDPLVSDRIEFELAAWHAERIGLDPVLYRDFLVQMLLTDPTMHTIGIPFRGWGDASAHPAPAAALDRVTRVPTAPDRVEIGPPDARLTLELAARVDFVRGPYRGTIETRSLLGRWWCAVVRCSDVPGLIDVGSVDDVDLEGLDDPSVAVVRDLLLDREPVGDTPPVDLPGGRVGDGEIDADGVVPVDSALGYLLGAEAGPHLAAGRDWTAGDETLPGSWYRPDLVDPQAELPWTYLHHIDLQWSPDVAAWIAEQWVGVAGPIPAPGPVPTWRAVD